MPICAEINQTHIMASFSLFVVTDQRPQAAFSRQQLQGA